MFLRLIVICLHPGGSDGKESACSVGDPGLIPGLGRSLEKGMATHSSILAWRIRFSLWRHKELDTTERISLSFLFSVSFSVMSNSLQPHGL